MMHGTTNIKKIRNCSNVDQNGNWTIRESLKCSDNNNKIVTFVISLLL